MAKKKDNLKELGAEEIKAKLDALRESVRAIRFNTQGSKSKNVKEQANLKKEVARLLTKLNQAKTAK